MTTIVSHLAPDLDSITAIWILLRFGGKEGAEFAFVPAGMTLDGQPVDSDPEVIHVDTGLGRFDHHQSEVAAPNICAARLVAEAVAPHDRALHRLVDYVVAVDNGLAPLADSLHPFGVGALIHGLNLLHPADPRAVVETVLSLLDAWYRAAQEVVAAEEELARARWFTTPWGPGIALAERTASAQQLAYAQGAVLYLARTPEGWTRLTAPGTSQVDLRPLAAVLWQREPEVHWYLHPSGKLLLNGSRKAPPRRLTQLTLDELVELVSQLAPVGER